MTSDGTASTSRRLKKAKEDLKLAEKQTYDRIYKVQQPKWKVGNQVLIRQDSVKPGSAKVLTGQRFEGPYIIEEIVKGRSDVGTAYMLRNKETGRPIHNLVSNDRLKAYNVDRRQFNERLPRIQTSEDKEEIFSGAAEKRPKNRNQLKYCLSIRQVRMLRSSI